jgi:hypothetical protein
MPGPDRGPDHGSDEPNKGPGLESEPVQTPNDGANESTNLSEINDNSRIIPVNEKTIHTESEMSDNKSLDNVTSTRIAIEESDPIEPWQFIPKPRGNTAITKDNNVDDNTTQTIDKTVVNTVKEKIQKIEKKVSKNKKNEKHSKNEKIIKGYELEKELLLCINNDTALNKLMATVKISQCRQIFDDLMEVDVIYNFLICIKKWCTTPLTPTPSSPTEVNMDDNEVINKDRSNCCIVFKWFESICKVDSFRILKLLLSDSQKEQLRVVLNDSLSMCCKNISGEEIHGVQNRVKDIRLLWQL